MPGSATRAGPQEDPARHVQHPAKDIEPSLSKVARAVAPGLDAALDLSDERDQWERLIDRAYRDGYRQAEHDHADDYERGLVDGALARKRAQHDLVDMARLDVRRWGPGGRERFADPVPGDYPGGAAGLARTRAAWLAAGLDLGPGPGWVHLSGAVVHCRHVCKPVCYQYKPGWYRIADAIAILARLPGDYAETIAEMRAMARSQEGKAAA